MGMPMLIFAETGRTRTADGEERGDSAFGLTVARSLRQRGGEHEVERGEAMSMVRTMAA